MSYKEIARILKSLLLMTAFVFSFTCVSYAANTEGIRVYKKILNLSPLHKKKIAEDIIHYHKADNLWDVLREEFSLAHYEEHPAVQEKIAWFMNNQDYLLSTAGRAAPFLFYIYQQVKKHHLPAEIVLVPIVESGYDPYAISNVGATGIWQMMPDTASGLGIKQDIWFDGRRDIITSTKAALNYFDYLKNFFEGNWLLALAAYNTGEGNVLAAIKRNIKQRKHTDFWSLPVSTQTKDYVPRLLALATIISHPDQYPVYLPPVRNAPYLAELDLGKQINFKYAALLAGISYKKLMRLNPGFNRLSTPKKGPYKLIFPIENVQQFTENFKRPLSKALDWIHYRVESGETLLSIARKFHLNPLKLRKTNHLTQASLQPGEILLIPFKSFSKEIKQNLNSSPAIKYDLQPGDTIYMVRLGDTLDTIAKRFHVAERNLYLVNRLPNNKLTLNQQLIIPTHLDFNDGVAETKKLSFLNTKNYIVQHGDTIEKIAQKFKTSSAAIRLANLIDNASLQEGERIIVPIHLRG